MEAHPCPGRRDKALPRGVYRTRPGSTKYKALARLNKRLIYLGTFATVEQANAAAVAWREGNAAAIAWHKATKRVIARRTLDRAV